MKVKVLVRNPEDYRRETKRDIHKVPRNLEPTLHPFETSREYQRALNATKLERVFAKPFLGALSGHRDGVHCLARHPRSLSTLLSGAYDGEVRIWNLGTRACVRTINAHTGYVRGIAVTPQGSHFYTVGDDKSIKQWSLESPGLGIKEEPTHTILTKSVVTGISHHWSRAEFATVGGSACSVWDAGGEGGLGGEPSRTYHWGHDTLHTVAFNPVETYLLASTASDRSVVFYDTRGEAPVRKVVLEMRSNKVAWNPMEAFTFTLANEDYNLYTFDMRNLQRPLNIHMDHVSAVLDVDYSPTGKEFVSGSFDKTVRIFNMHQGRSREVYHTRRMQKVMCVAWTQDDRYLVSGSDEMNLRLWKARAADKLGPLTSRESSALEYSAALREKFAAHPAVRRIARHRHVPKTLYHAGRELNAMRQASKRKEANRRAHSKPGAVPHVSERDKHVVNEHE